MTRDIHYGSLLRPESESQYSTEYGGYGVVMFHKFLTHGPTLLRLYNILPGEF